MVLAQGHQEIEIKLSASAAATYEGSRDGRCATKLTYAPVGGINSLLVTAQGFYFLATGASPLAECFQGMELDSPRVCDL